MNEWILGWPDPELRPEYPFVALLVMHSVPMRPTQGPEVLFRRTGNASTYLTAYVRSRIHLHFFFQKDQENNDFSTQLYAFFDSQRARGTIEVGKNTENWGDYRLDDVSLETTESGLREGERRTIARILARTLQVSDRNEAVWKSYQLDGRISEHQKVGGNG